MKPITRHKFSEEGLSLGGEDETLAACRDLQGISVEVVMEGDQLEILKTVDRHNNNNNNNKGCS